MPDKWRYSAGVKPNTVTVFERVIGGILYARAWDSKARAGKGNWRRKSLGHRNKAKAKRYAIGEAAKLQNGESAITEVKVTLGKVFSRYEQHRTPRKSATEQKSDKRRIKLWSRVLGAGSDPHGIRVEQWEAFIDARSSGAIDANGNPVTSKKRKPVRARTVQADCLWLNWVFNWAAKWRLASSAYLMRENPVRGYDVPKELNPYRALATQDRYEATRAVTDRVRISDNGKCREGRSYLSELLDIINDTGRRISAVCGLRFENLRLERTRTAPHGAIVWPAETAKNGRESVVPMTPRVRAAIDRVLTERPGIGSVPLFPSPQDSTKSMTRHLADKWLRKAEELAELPPLKGKLWHAYRGKWATERKHLSPVDVAAAGGWANVVTLQTVYQQADEETLLEVVMGGGELREAR